MEDTWPAPLGARTKKHLRKKKEWSSRTSLYHYTHPGASTHKATSSRHWRHSANTSIHPPIGETNPPDGVNPDKEPQTHPKTCTPPFARTTIVEEWKPYLSSHFLSGKLGAKLLQSWSRQGVPQTSLGRRHAFERLPQAVKNWLSQFDSYGLMVDFTRLPLYGSFSITGRLRDVSFTNPFIIRQIKENVILGMPFLVQEECTTEFGRPLHKKEMVRIHRPSKMPITIWHTCGTR